MKLDRPTLAERIREMTDVELAELATGEALAMADSSRIEGLILDEEAIRAGLLAGYGKIKAEAQSRSPKQKPKAEAQSRSPKQKPKAEAQSRSPKQKPKAEAQSRISAQLHDR